MAPGSSIVTPPLHTYQRVLLWFRLFLLLVFIVVFAFIIIIFCFDLCSVGLLLILKVLLYLKNIATLLDHVSVAAPIHMSHTHCLRSLPLVLRLCDQINLCPGPVQASCAAASLQQKCSWSVARPAMRKTCGRKTCCGLHINVLQQLAKPRDNILVHRGCRSQNAKGTGRQSGQVLGHPAVILACTERYRATDLATDCPESAFNGKIIKARRYSGSRGPAPRGPAPQRPGPQA